MIERKYSHRRSLSFAYRLTTEMSIPTGMSPQTAMHYRNIDVQLRNVFNQSYGQQQRAAHGQMHQFHVGHGVAFAGNGLHKYVNNSARSAHRNVHRHH